MKHLLQKKQWIILFVSLLLVIVTTVGVTVAYVFTTSGPVTNTFTPTPVEVEVDETLENGVKSDVNVKNTGEAEAYIRATVVINWQDDSGNVYFGNPVGGTLTKTNEAWTKSSDDADYWIAYNATEWTLGADGYYYYTSPVAANSSTTDLIERCEANSSKIPAGYSLTVQIIAEAIQSTPTDVVTAKWENVTSVNDDKTLEIQITTTSEEVSGE